MLAKKTESAIAILYEAGGYVPSSGAAFIACNNLGEQVDIIASLTTAGLLDHCGKLSRPLESISLYDVLEAMDDGIYPALKEQRDYFGLPNKQQLYHSMIKQLLSRVKVSELRETYKLTNLKANLMRETT